MTATLRVSSGHPLRVAVLRGGLAMLSGTWLQPTARGRARATADRAIVAALADPAALQVFAALATAAASDQHDSERQRAIVHHGLAATGLATATGLSPDAATARLAAAGLIVEGIAPPLNWWLNTEAPTSWKRQSPHH